MYTYSFNIYFRSNNDFYMGIDVKAEDKFSWYESIIIRDLDEKCENWSTNVKDALKRKISYTKYGSIFIRGRFFEWLEKQCVLGIPSHVSALFSPYELYNVLTYTDEYTFSLDTDDPSDIGNEEDVRAYVAAHYDPNVDY